MVASALTVQDMIDQIVAAFGGPLEGTCDTVKSGDTSQPVRGVVTTFMATVPVIKQAAAMGANVIFTHEPTFFNATDEIAFLNNDPVYQAKLRLLQETGVVVYRLHDYPHGLPNADHVEWARGGISDDPFRVGLIEAMGWQEYADPESPSFCTIPPTSLRDLIQQFKARLHVKTVRAVGDPNQVCRKVLLFLGGTGIFFHAPALERFAADVIVTGECPEWETFSYAYDAQQLGIERALLAVGHEPSEEPGMAVLTSWLQDKFPDVTFTHVPAANPVATY